ncbi:diaminopimelate dehydrogenase [Helcobacillus massiliensis]|uniref:diaminopimelate dehydrogenase n=1 Tax=Helcobacillus massiliensis TaxID=521392 RepID=UPI002554D3B2|nr:diaminopimelate dehydrogenase [Helcobacillus massiliensis]MDK7741716.1 diaminopimelate dehydrogenase [Helcobacillus massiliensis]WOO92188.1 diaminopimelate dehydrogenase [Helcobacillus massiliensis]
MTETKRIRAAIAGYGNLGRSAEKLIRAQDDMDLVGIFSRRSSLDTDTPVFPADSAAEHTDDIDVVLLCLGSATDIPEQATGWAELFTTVDTYDNHADIPGHRARMDAAARANGNTAMVGTGWDPGLFSVNRTMAEALFPSAQQNTFWGLGASQGHSDAVRRVPGVQRAVQYTIPSDGALQAARRGDGADITAHTAHRREVVAVAEESEQERIREQIVSMPNYFEPYETTVEFVSTEEFEKSHQGLPHGGRVITTGDLGGSLSTVEFSLELERNPDFTAAAQVAYARAAARMNRSGQVGAFTVLEVAPYLLSPIPLDELIARDV